MPSLVGSEMCIRDRFWGIVRPPRLEALFSYCCPMSSRVQVEAALHKIETIDKSGYTLNSVLAVREAALADADAYDKAGKDLPLKGQPILIKDNIEALGLPATAGSLALADTPVESDSPLVTRLKEAGAIIVGATNLSEWANIRSTKSTSGWSAVGGLTANPWIHAHSACLLYTSPSPRD